MRNGTTISRLVLVEQNLERIKYPANLRLQYLKSIYDGRPIFERYLTGDARIHLHCLWKSTPFCREEICICVAKRTASKCGTCGPYFYEVPMLVCVGQNPKKAQRIVSIIRLQSLNQCAVFDADSFKVSLNPTAKLLWRIVDRKLCALSRLPIVKFRQGVDHLVQGRAESHNDTTDARTDVLKSIWMSVLEDVRIGFLRLCGNDIQLLFREGRNFFFQLHQLFASPF